jgi:hypothetical protein
LLDRHFEQECRTLNTTPPDSFIFSMLFPLDSHLEVGYSGANFQLGMMDTQEKVAAFRRRRTLSIYFLEEVNYYD